jgi:hypothetical protein
LIGWGLGCSAEGPGLRVWSLGCNDAPTTPTSDADAAVDAALLCVRDVYLQTGSTLSSHLYLSRRQGRTAGSVSYSGRAREAAWKQVGWRGSASSAAKGYGVDADANAALWER